MATAEEFKELGNKAFAGGDFKAAVQHFTEAISLSDGSNHVLFSNRSAAFASLKNYSAALADAQKTVAIKPDWAKGYSRLGAAFHGLRRLQDAQGAYRKGLELEAENKACKDGLAAVTKELEEASAQPSGDNVLASAFSAPDTMDKLRKNPATAEFMKDPEFVKKMESIRANPNTLQLYLQDKRVMQALLALMGVSGKVATDMDDLKMMDDEEEGEDDIPPPPAATAAPTASAAPFPSPSSSSSSSSKPAAGEADAEPMETEESGPKVSAADKAKAAAQKELGTAAYKSKDFETALTHYNQAASLDPTDMVYQLNISAVYFEQKAYDECIAAALKAVEVGESNKGSFETLGKAYARAAKAAAAKDDLEQALKYIGKALTNHRNPEYVATQKKMEAELAERKRKAYLDPAKALEHKNKGNDLFKAGDFPAAEREYSESLRRNPDDSKVYGNRAACYIKLAAFPLAVQDCEAAIKLEPGFIKAYVRKGNALAGMKKHSEAQSAFYKALELDANNSEAPEGLQKCRTAMYSGMSKEERTKAAMKDPEIQKIMGDPVMNTILQQMMEDPKAAREHMRDPAIAASIQKLVEAGIIGVA